MRLSRFCNWLFKIFVMVFLTTASLVALAQNAPAQAKTCAACHGAQGISVNDVWPNLAGQKAQYLIQQLEAFRSGERRNPLMSPVSKTLSDDDIKTLAAYFSHLQSGTTK